MKVIFSHLKYPCSPSQSSPQLAALSNYCAKKIGFETILFADEDSLKRFKTIEYTHHELITECEKNKFPKCLWNTGKLIALKKVKEPVIHLDMDIFLKKHFKKNKLNNDIICLHDEIFKQHLIIRLQKLFKDYRPKKTIGMDIISYNCGIIGGNDYETLHKSIDVIFDYLVENFDFIEKINKKYSKNIRFNNIFYPPVLVEQVWLFQILKNVFNKKIITLVDSPINWQDVHNKLRNEHIVHLMSGKNLTHCTNIINNEVDKLNLKY